MRSIILVVRSQILRKKRVGDVQFQIKSGQKREKGIKDEKIGRDSDPTPVARGGWEKDHPLAARPVPWNGRGRRLVELIEGCYSGGNSQGFQG